MEQLGFHCTDFRKIWYWNISRNSVEKIQIYNILTKRTGTLHEDQYTFFIYLAQLFLELKMFLEELETHILCLIIAPLPSRNTAVCEVMWKYVRDSQRLQYGACTLHAGYLRQQIHTQVVKYLLLFIYNDCRTNAPPCYVIRALHVLL